MDNLEAKFPDGQHLLWLRSADDIFMNFIVLTKVQSLLISAV